MGEGNFGVLWMVAGLLALLSVGQTLWQMNATQTCTAGFGLPHALCSEVVGAARPVVAEAARLYRACRFTAGVGSEALCAHVVRGYLTVSEASLLYRTFPHVSEWEWKQLTPLTAGYMLGPAHHNWPWRTILQGRVSVGMSDTQVIAAWGFPSLVSRTTSARVVVEVWVYRGGSMDGTRRLVFRDGILTTLTVER